VVREHLAVALTQLLEQDGRSFDVAEEEGDRAARKLRQEASSRLPDPRPGGEDELPQAAVPIIVDDP
jgi:hypothetical protein